MDTSTPPFFLPGSVSLRIIALGIILAFCYLASSVVVPLLASIILAYFLDPAVAFLERLRLPRALGALLVVVLVMSLFGLLGWMLVERLDNFGADWPKYRQPLREALTDITHRLDVFEARVSELTPSARNTRTVVEVTSPHPARDLVFERLSSLYPVMFGLSFVPFLVFFMLSGKRQVWHAAMQFFSVDRRNAVKDTLEKVGYSLRSYVAGIALVGLFLIVASWIFFWSIGLDYPFLLALVSGTLNLVPYIGNVAAWIPPFLIGLNQFHSLSSYLLIAGMLSFFHIIAGNVLFPALVGRRLKLNAVAVTVALLFWGWMWGAPGLLLAIPITATIKVVCDNVEGWRPVARWLGS
jgi:predicted PurR-regulated permease PerM